MQVLVAYASRHGSTREIAERIAEILAQAGCDVDCLAMEQVEDVTTHDAVVVGSAVHDQAWLEEASTFVASNRAALVTRPVWLFSVGMPGALPRRLRTWAMQEEPLILAKLGTGLRPRGHRLFSGAVHKSHLNRAGRAAFRALGGRYGDYRNWHEIEAWAAEIAWELRASGPARGA